MNAWWLARPGLLALLVVAIALTPLGPRPDAGPVGSEPPYQLVPTGPAGVTGRTLTVAPGGDVQQAVESAKPGDTIVLQAGATYQGPITLPAKAGDGWLVIRSSAADALPAGQRVRPQDASRMARIVSPRASEPAIRTAPGAHHVKLIGLELTVAPGTYNQGLVVLGRGDETRIEQFPHHLVIERCYIHGDAQSGGKRGIALNGRAIAVVDSFLADWKGVGQETQAIAGWNGPGPFKVVNNHVEGAGINLLFGGADPSMANLVPGDIEIRRNLFTKPLAWRNEKWVVKNLFELKNARRVLVDGNVFEHSWAAAQAGFAVVLTPRNQDGKAPWSVVEDVTFTNNVVRGAASGISIAGRDDNAPSEQTRRIKIVNNLFLDIDKSTWGGHGWLFMMLRGTRDVTIEHNTGFPTTAILSVEPPAHTGFVFRNNIVSHGLYGVKGSDMGSGEPTLRAAFVGPQFEGNVLIGSDLARYPAGNRAVRDVGAVGFVDPRGGDWRLAPSSPLKGTADGRDPGADVDRVARATGLGPRLERAAAR